MNFVNSSVDTIPELKYSVYFDESGPPVVVSPGIPFQDRYRENSRLQAKLNHPADALRPGWGTQTNVRAFTDRPDRFLYSKTQFLSDIHHGDALRKFQN